MPLAELTRSRCSTLGGVAVQSYAEWIYDKRDVRRTVSDSQAFETLATKRVGEWAASRVVGAIEVLHSLPLPMDDPDDEPDDEARAAAVARGLAWGGMQVPCERHRSRCQRGKKQPPEHAD